MQITLSLTKVKKTFYATNADRMSNRPSNTSWSYLNVGSYNNSYMYQTFVNGENANMYVRVKNSSYGDWKKIWVEGNSVTDAVQDDYAEYRESDCEEFGRVVFENGDDTLSKTTKRLQHFADVTSDTWRFCQGETEKVKTPITVAGRILVYTYQDRNNYKLDDCVCAAPDGTVDIMTQKEIILYPDKIVGTVSCVPTYNTCGSGDRPPVDIDGRICIKVK